VRRAFATRTIFNLLGPLANPCRPAFQIVGVYAPEHCRPLARTLSMLEVEAALVIHGGGIDEIALHGPTIAALWKADRLTEIEITPEIAGMRRRPLDALRGGEPASNAAELRLLLEGRGREAYAEAVSINAGALAWISGKCPTLEAGAALARDAVAGGGAIRRLDRCVEISHAS